MGLHIHWKLACLHKHRTAPDSCFRCLFPPAAGTPIVCPLDRERSKISISLRLHVCRRCSRHWRAAAECTASSANACRVTWKRCIACCRCLFAVYRYRYISNDHNDNFFSDNPFNQLIHVHGWPSLSQLYVYSSVLSTLPEMHSLPKCTIHHNYQKPITNL